jgi:hypothetical protein
MQLARCDAADAIGNRGMIVHATPDGAAKFYVSRGCRFIVKMKMIFIFIDDLEALGHGGHDTALA